jgi:endonuclease YncB( thermonuclease family)
MPKIMSARLLAALVLLPGLLAGCSPAAESGGRTPRVKQARPEQSVAGRASVIDGDTLEIHGRRIRLHAIDAPESRQTCQRDGKPWPCGRRAANALAEEIGTRPVECRWRETDRYDRAVAVCRTNGADLGGWMVEHGWALAFRRYGKDYVADETGARAARRGLWAGSFVPPWDYRAGRREAVSATTYPEARG